MLGKYF